MIKFINNNERVIIVLHEIYGINQHMHQVCEYYSSLGFDVICPDLLSLNKSFDYAVEQEAYENFKKNVGFIPTADRIKRLLKELKEVYKYVFILGFSAGASIAWLCSDSDVKCDGIIGYYGSRIRDYLYVVPNCKVLLIFAEDEKSFSPRELLRVLSEKTNVSAHVLVGKHGFSDPFSPNYCAQARDIANRLVNDFLSGL
ncbi:dienelactone hydrolase family protein [Clostridium oryzae]|uniref:Carboxymethylenebutenolidase n=1 Tax=Clostridium oryzae TaxID=1450648 RepID=A0A1V4IVX7_9CLOT|nr:dienelactone hydrolase family protein [Clostridium oryzae]OPJ64191.1 carboxymethylenebutenolidase [Clostridium oryzae]